MKRGDIIPCEAGSHDLIIATTDNVIFTVYDEWAGYGVLTLDIEEVKSFKRLVDSNGGEYARNDID